jgi:hypothetical protein
LPYSFYVSWNWWIIVWINYYYYYSCYWLWIYDSIRGEKKTKESRKPRKSEEKNNWKNQSVKKNLLNRLKFWKNRPIRFCFGFISLKLKKSNWIKPSQTEKTKSNRFEPVFVLKKPNQNRSVWTSFGFGFFKKKFSLIIFFNKNQTEPKIIGTRFDQQINCAS